MEIDIHNLSFDQAVDTCRISILENLIKIGNNLATHETCRIGDKGFDMAALVAQALNLYLKSEPE